MRMMASVPGWTKPSITRRTFTAATSATAATRVSIGSATNRPRRRNPSHAWPNPGHSAESSAAIPGRFIAGAA